MNIISKFLRIAFPELFIDKKTKLENKNYQTQNNQPPRLRCVKCNGENINVTFQQMQEQGTSQTKTVKRSLASRTAQGVGRGTANLMTLGMYGAFVPKKGKYKQITTTQNRIINQKIALCQECGHSWFLR